MVDHGHHGGLVSVQAWMKYHSLAEGSTQNWYGRRPSHGQLQKIQVRRKNAYMHYKLYSWLLLIYVDACRHENFPRPWRALAAGRWRVRFAFSQFQPYETRHCISANDDNQQQRWVIAAWYGWLLSELQWWFIMVGCRVLRRLFASMSGAYALSGLKSSVYIYTCLYSF